MTNVFHLYCGPQFNSKWKINLQCSNNWRSGQREIRIWKWCVYVIFDSSKHLRLRNWFSSWHAVVRPFPADWPYRSGHHPLYNTNLEQSQQFSICSYTGYQTMDERSHIIDPFLLVTAMIQTFGMLEEDRLANDLESCLCITVYPSFGVSRPRGYLAQRLLASIWTCWIWWPAN